MAASDRRSATIVGIGGGTCSGKTTVAQKVVASIGEERALHLPQDSYYRNLGEMPLDMRRQVNFDHPDAFDGELMLNQLEALRSGRCIDRPIYDFVAHARKPETLRVAPLPVIVVEGILIYADPRMRRLMDLKVFVDCDADVRLARRLQRDIQERGRSLASVIEQYLATVRPMHQQFVAPSMSYADVILPEGGFNDAGIDLLVEKICSSL